MIDECYVIMEEYQFMKTLQEEREARRRGRIGNDGDERWWPVGRRPLVGFGSESESVREKFWGKFSQDNGKKEF